MLEATATLAEIEYGRGGEADVSMRVVADHLRAIAFLLADGVIPASEGRGYVLRRLLRRAVRHGMRLGFEEPFLCRLLPVVDEAMAGAYPELGATRAASEATVRAEEEKFLTTVAVGSKMVQEAIEEAKQAGSDELPGAVAFRLYDTYGLPIQLLREITEEEKFGVDEEGFTAALERQQERSRAATDKDQAGRARLQQFIHSSFPNLPASEFVGYQRLSIEGAKIVAAARLGKGDPADSVEAAETLGAGDEGALVFDRTPFYAESGGQVGDIGGIRWPGGAGIVIDTQKDNAGVIYHFVKIGEGELRQPFPLMELYVVPEIRVPTQRNHSATHLLQAALQQELGSGVRQAGSLVRPDDLRFDFTHDGPLTSAQRTAVEKRVNGWVMQAVDLRIVNDRPIGEARAAGAMALFGEKYGERVRTVEVPGISLELCGGCHVRNTGEIGPFRIRSERGVASGVRRIEAITGEAALDYLVGRDEDLAAVEAGLGASQGRAVEEVESLRGQVKQRDGELAKLRAQLVSGAAATEEQLVDGIRVLAREVPPAPAGELRNLADMMRDKLGSGVVVLGARTDEKVQLVATVSADLRKRIPAGRLVKEIARLVGGSGGGRDDFAQAGGKRPEELTNALGAVPATVARLVSSEASVAEE